MLGIGRYYDGEKLIAIYNFSDEEKKTTLWNEDGELFDVFSGHVINKREIEIPANSFRWLMCDFDEPEKGIKRKLICLDWDHFSKLNDDGKLKFTLQEKWSAVRSAGDRTLIYSKRFLTVDAYAETFPADTVVCADGAYVSEKGKILLDYPLPQALINAVLSYVKGKTLKAEIESPSGEIVPVSGKTADGQKYYCLYIHHATEKHLSDLKKRMIGNYEVSVLGKNENGRYEAAILNQSFDIQSGINRVADKYGIAAEDISDFLTKEIS